MTSPSVGSSWIISTCLVGRILGFDLFAGVGPFPSSQGSGLSKTVSIGEGSAQIFSGAQYCDGAEMAR